MQQEDKAHPERFCEIKYRTSTGYDHTVYGSLLSINADSLTYRAATDDQELQVINLHKSIVQQIKFIHEEGTVDTTAA